MLLVNYKAAGMKLVISVIFFSGEQSFFNEPPHTRTRERRHTHTGAIDQHQEGRLAPRRAVVREKLVGEEKIFLARVIDRDSTIIMLALCLAAQAFSSPTVHVAQPVVRSSPVQMMATEMPSRRAAVLSAASLLALPFAAEAKPEDYAGGCTFAPRHFHAH